MWYFRKKINKNCVYSDDFCLEKMPSIIINSTVKETTITNIEDTDKETSIIKIDENKKEIDISDLGRIDTHKITLIILCLLF